MEGGPQVLLPSSWGSEACRGGSVGFLDAAAWGRGGHPESSLRPVTRLEPSRPTGGGGGARGNEKRTASRRLCKGSEKQQPHDRRFTRAESPGLGC